MNVKTLILLVSLSISGLVSAQSKYIKDANSEFRSGNYFKAAEKCALAYSKIRRSGGSALDAKGDMAFKTAESFRNLEDFKQANDWYQRAILLKYQNKEPLVLLYNADMLRIMGDLKKAAEYYKEYQELVPTDTRAEVGLKSCEIHEDFVDNRTTHTVTNLSQLNKDGYDMSPTFVDKKASVIAFSSSREGVVGKDKDKITGDLYMDIFVTEIDKKGNFTQIKPIEGEGINTENNEGTVCIDGRAKTMFFTRCPHMKKQNLGCDIWMSEAGSKGWEAPKKLELKDNDTISVGHPCVSDDGKFLIFASDMPGGVGGRDLWFTSYDRKKDAWTKPQNMGPEINTAGDELFPTFAANGDLIYSSTGLPGLGGLDLFKARKLGADNKWENPVNMGSPLNSESHDYALIEQTDRKGYFTSERTGGTGNNVKPDLYMYELPPNIFSLTVNVYDNSDNKRKTKIEGVKVVVTAKTGEKWEGITAKNGSVSWDKKPNGDRFINENSSYKIMISKPKYLEDKKGAELTTEGVTYNQNFIIDMGLYPDRPIKLPEVRYPTAQWTFVVDSTINSLDSLAVVYTMFEQNPGLVIELSSHTDSRGPDVSNQVLSENRAKACYKYLVEQKGVDPRRIVPAGKGEREPRKMYLKDGKYYEKPTEGASEVLLTEAYINTFKADVAKYNMLLQLNRRTEARILSLEFDPATAPASNPEYLKFKIVPKN